MANDSFNPDNTKSFCVFETPLGWMGLGWSDLGVTLLRFPEPDAQAARARLKRAAPSALEERPRGAIAEAVALLLRYARGERVDFASVPVDLDGLPQFNRAVYAAARRLGYGRTSTYGALCADAGHPGMARETGKALGENPVPVIVPCHRIVASGGKLGGFSAPGGVGTKQRLLTLESARPAAASDQAAFAF